MKKLAAFSLSLSIATLLFTLTAIVCLGLTYISDKKSLSAPSSEASVSTDTKQSITVLVVYKDEQNCFLSRLFLDLNNGRCHGETLDYEDFDKNHSKFIITGKDFFIKIADRYGGLVYNEDNGAISLLTGKQAVSVLDAELFTEFCVQLCSTASNDSLYDLFVLLADNTENNLNYPDFYNAIDP